MTGRKARYTPYVSDKPDEMARARSIHEMHFAASLEPCPTCGARIDPQQLSLAGDGDAWALSGDCPRCRTPRGFSFRTHGDPLTAPSARDEVGGPKPSEIIKPSRWLAEIDRLLIIVRPDPTQLGIAPWQANRDDNKRLLICLNELLKFIPDGAAEIPLDALDPDERADWTARPEHYQRAWLSEQREGALALRARNVADLPRIEKLEHGGERTKAAAAPTVELDRDTLRAHENWVRAGQKGKGRLVAVGADEIGARIGAAELTGASLEDVNLTEADLAFVTLDGAKLKNVQLARANLGSASFRGAIIDAGSLANATLDLAKFDDATIEGTAFTEASLDRSQWLLAKVSKADFAEATFGNATLDGAVFVRCDFRGASFGPLAPRPDPTTRGTRFEECDLRGTSWSGRDLSGAVFIRCKLDGIEGPPSAADDIVIEEPDLSHDGDGSDIATVDDVLMMWFPVKG